MVAPIGVYSFMEQILRGTIDAYGFSVIEAQIANSNNEGVLIKGVVDTAAYKFYLKQSVIDFLKLPVIGRTNDAHATEGEGDVILYSCGLEIQNFDLYRQSVLSI